MALFKIFKGSGTLENLNAKRPSTVEGYCYFTPEDGKFYIDTWTDAEGEATGTNPAHRVVLNAETADRAYFYGGGGVGSSTQPIYIAGSGQPIPCDDTLAVNISGKLKDIQGNFLNIGDAQTPIYFLNGGPEECGDNLNVNITGNAATATQADEATHADSATEADKAAGAYYLLSQETNSSLDVGGVDTPIYFNNGVPTPCNTLKLPQKGDEDTPIYVDSNGAIQSCVDFLPLTAGETKKISGPLGLTADINYGLTFPSESFEGEIFFVEDQREWLYLPSGGTAGQALIKNSDTDGDASWVTLSDNYLPLTGGTLTGPLFGTYYATTNYGTFDPSTSTPGYGVNGTLYFKIIS